LNDQFVEGIWKESGASPEYLAAMRLALLTPEGQQEKKVGLSILPDLCCQAAGGNQDLSCEVSAAWSLLYDAAHLYDVIQDNDPLEPSLHKLGLAAAINVASGLVVSGLAVLNRLYQRWETSEVAGEICSRFYEVGIQMSGGQHRDLIMEQPGVEDWFEIAEAKSGTFFGLACWAGARLATADARRLDGFSSYGSHLGVLLQIHDDLADLGEMRNGDKKPLLKGLKRSLPVVYALEVFPEEAKAHLLECLMIAAQDKDATRDVLTLLDRSGAALFLKIEIERRQALARAALDAAKPDPSLQESLFSFTSKLEKHAKPGDCRRE
jgi:geranylgeranyl pyrophosphate synthase